MTIADNFSNSNPNVIARLEELANQPIPTHVVDLTDYQATDRLFQETQPDAVIHFAGLKAVGESVEQPTRYYRNNLDSALAVVHAMLRHNVTNIVFSSSATVYGPRAPVPYQEDCRPLEATNPYGQTKVMIERILTDTAAANPGWNTWSSSGAQSPDLANGALP